jgi:hypothetical protein
MPLANTRTTLMGKFRLLAKRMLGGALTEPPQPQYSQTAPAQEPPNVQALSEATKAVSEELKYVGPYTHHLRRRQNNILFPEERRIVAPREWQDAALYDSPRIKAHKERSVEIVTTIVAGAREPKGKSVTEALAFCCETLSQLDECIKEHVFLQGTSSEKPDEVSGPLEWNPDKDAFLEIFLKLRGNLENSTRQFIAQVYEEPAISSFSNSRDRNHKSSFERSHFHQLIGRKCFFFGGEDFFPRLFSESDNTFLDYIQFCKLSDGGDEMLKELKRAFLVCFEKTKNQISQLPIGPDESAHHQIRRNLGYVAGMVSKGQILGLLSEDSSYAISYAELEAIIKS